MTMINVAYCATRNHYPVVLAAVKSLLLHTPVDHVYFLIEDDEFPTPLPDCITTINVSNQTWFPSTGANYKSAWTYMAYTRLALAKLLPDVSTILYLDTDTIVMQDISDLFQTNLTEHLFGMVREDIGDTPLEICNGFAQFDQRTILPFRSDSPRPAYVIRPYYNSGVMLMNLAELRQTGMDDALINDINTTPHDYPDQDAINLICHDQIVLIPQCYNHIQSVMPPIPPETIRIRHYASEKPIWLSSVWQRYKHMSWDAVWNGQKR